MANIVPSIWGPSVLYMGTREFIRFDAYFGSSIFTNDPDGTIVAYEFTDNTSGLGYFTLDGLPYSGSVISVGASELARVGYYTGTTLGTNQLSIRVLDDAVAYSNTLSFPIELVGNFGNKAPIITGPSDYSRETSTYFQFAPLISAVDTDGWVKQYRFTDTVAGTGNLVNFMTGVAITGNSITVSVENLATVGYLTGSTPGTNGITIEAIDAEGLASSSALTMTITTTNRAPVLTGPETVTRNVNESFVFTSGDAAISASDADGTVAQYRFTDSVPGTGNLTLNGSKITGTSVTVTAVNLGQVGYSIGALSGSNSIDIEAIDNLGAASSKLTMAVTVANTAPTLTGPTTLSKSGLQTFDIGSLFTASDPDGTVATWVFSDPTPGGDSYLKVGGSRVDSVTMSGSTLGAGAIEYYTGTSPSTNTIVVKVLDNLGVSSNELQVRIDAAPNTAPTISGPASVSAGTNQTFNFISGAATITGADLDGEVTHYRFTDSILGAGYLTFDEVKITGTVLTVAADDLGRVGYATGAVVGSNVIAIESIDNANASSPVALAMTINVGSGNQTPSITGPTSVTKGLNESFTFGSASGAGVVVLGASDVDGTVAQYRFTDSTAGAGYLTLNGVQITGTSVTVTAANLGQVGYTTGAVAGSNSIEIESIDNLGLASSTALSMTVNVTGNEAPTISGPTTVATGINQSFKFGTTSTAGVVGIGAGDADGTVAQYRFTDSVAGAGYLTQNGAKIAGTSVTVSAADLGEMGYTTGAFAGSNAITIESIDNLGLASTSPLTMTISAGKNASGNEAPIISGPASVSATTNQMLTFASMIDATDADGTVMEYQFTDLSGPGTLTLNGAVASSSFFVTAADLGQVGFSTGAATGSNSISIDAIDDLGAWSTLNMLINTGANQPPVLTGPATVSKSLGQSFDFASLISGSDPDSAIASYLIYDISPGLGYLTLDGAQVVASEVDVPTADLGKVGYYTGTAVGSNWLTVYAKDSVGGALSEVLWMEVVTAPNNAPTLSGPASVSKGVNQNFGFTSGAAMITATDTDGAVAQYRFTDSSPGAGYLTLNGVAAPGTFTVAAANLGQVSYHTGLGAGSNAISIEAIDNLGLSSPRLTMTINVASNQAPTISGPSTVSKGTSETFTFATAAATGVVVLSATDADGTVAQYRFSDSTPGAGYLTLNGVAAPSVFTVAAADLGKVGYSTGLGTGSNAIAIEAIDNLGLASPGLLTMTISVTGTSGAANQAPTISGPASVRRNINEAFTFTSLVSATDADGTVAQYRFSDSMAGAGYLTQNGAQIAGTSVTVSAANLGQMGYSTGASAGSNSIAIEAIDNLGLASSNLLTMTIDVAGTTGTGTGGTGGTGGSGTTPNLAPTISGPSSVSKSTNEFFTFTSLISAADADGSVAHYRFSDYLSGAGYLTQGGVGAPSVFTVAAADLGQVGYATGMVAGSNSIAIEAIDNLGLASPNVLMMSISVAGAAGTGGTGGIGGTANVAPAISGPSSVSKATNESFTFTSLISGADADGSVAQYRFTDIMSGAGYLTLGGAAAPGVFTVAAADLGKVAYYTGLAQGSNSFAIEAIDNIGLASPNPLLMTVNVAGSALSTGASSGRTVVSSDGIGEAPLIGTGGLLTVEAGTSTANFALHASGSIGVISDIAIGGIRYTFSNFAEFLFNGGTQGDTVKVSTLAGTGIGNQGVFLNGNGGNDTLDASAADGGVLAFGGAGQDRLFGGSQDDELSGDAGDDQLTAGRGNDVLWGGDGNDTFLGLQGHDIVNGGGGDDVLEFTDLTAYTMTPLRGNSFMVSDAAGNLAIVRDVEHTRLAGSGAAAPNSPLARGNLDERVVELYVAAFGRAPETEGYDFWADLEAREGIGQVADTIFSLPVVKAIHADSMSASQFVTAIYENVFDRAPDAQGLDFWVNMLRSTSRGSLVLDMTSAALGVADGTDGKDFFQNRVDWAMFAVHYQDATRTGLAPEYLHALTDGVSADAASLVTLVGQFQAALP